MNASFTICANNYLSSAKVLKESFSKYHPEIPFFIVLVDRKDASLNYNDFGGDSILFIDDIVDLNVSELSFKFNISELCTTLKPFVFTYLFKNNTKVVYIDPDIKVYAPLKECWDALNEHSFVLTPHLMSPIDDGKMPSDFMTLRTGIFNLGFIGLSAGAETDKFLSWWGERLLVYGYNDWDNGMFYDQIWANYIPVLFNKYYILKHYGYNVANWNWHERYIKIVDGEFIVNDKYPLVFFHFSSYKYAYPNILCRYNTRCSKENRPDLAPIFNGYYNDLTIAGAENMENVKAFYHQQNTDHVWKVNAPQRMLIRKIIRRLIKILKAI